MGERRTFFKNRIKNGKVNASATPSSKYLAQEMIKGVDFDKVDAIIELGPGTGIFTEHIIKKTKENTKIIVIEIEKSYIEILKDKFGDKIIIEQDDVKNIDQIRKKHNIENIDLIVSGLPFVPAESIKSEIKSYTENGTIFRSFTYQPGTFESHYKELPMKKKGFTLLNLPPARVYGIN